MASDFKLSVVLEAVTAAFNSSIKQAAATFTKAEADMASAATSAGSAATSAGAAEVTAARNAGNAATEAAGQSAAAARSAAAANAAVRPPSSFKEFFAGMKDGWQQAMASARTATADTAAAADSAGNHIKGLKDQIDGVGPAAKAAGKEIADALNVKSVSTAQMDKLKAALNALGPTAKKVGTDVEAALALRNLSPAQIEKIKKSMSDLGPQAEKAGKETEKGLTLGGLVKSVGAIATVKQALQELIQNAVQLQQITNQLSFATGGIAQGAAAFGFLRDTANSLGLSLEASAKGFAQLSVATKGTQLEGQATRDLFLGVSQAAATMGLSTADTEGVFNALSQIASKGTVQMEELRGQLGDRLPGVLKIAADSMGKTVAELNNLVGSGLDANQFLKNFGPALQAAFSAQAAENLKTLGGQIAVLKNQFFDLLSTINASGAGAGLTVLTHDLGEALKNLGQLFREASGSPDFQAFNEVLVGTYSTIKDDIAQLASTAVALFDTLDSVFSAITSLASTLAGGDLDGHQLGLLESVLGGVSISLGLVGDGLKGLEIAFLSISAVAQSSFGLIALTAGRIAGVFNKELGQSLTDLGDKLLKGANDAGDKATAKMLSFTSGAAKAFDNLAAAADKANATLDPSKQLATAQASLEKYLAVARSGAQPVLEIQAQADTLSAAFKNLYDKGAIGAGQLRAALDKITAGIPPAKAATEDFLSAIIKLGANKAANFSALADNAKEIGASLKGDITEGVAEALVSFAKLGDSAGTSSRTVRLAFTNLINKAETAADIDAATQELIAMSARGKITGDDVSDAFTQIADQALKLKTVLPQSVSDALASVGAKTNEELNRDAELAQRYVDRVAQLVRDNKVSTDALNTAIVNAANAAAAGVQKALTFAGAATAQQLAAQVQQAQTYVNEVVEQYKLGNVKIQAVLDAQQKLLQIQQSGIAKALEAVGVKSNAELQAAVAQAKANLQELTEAAGRNEVSYKAVTIAQRQYADAIAATVPGAVSLADVQERLNALDKEAIENQIALARAREAAAAKAKTESETRRANTQKETEEGAALNAQFNTTKTELLALSAAAANEFGHAIGVQFGYVESGAAASQAAIEGLRTELTTLQTQAFSGVDFIGISTKMRELGIEAAKVKLEFAEQQQAALDSQNRIQALADSGTASLAQLQAATKLSGASFGILGQSDLTGLNSALDAAKNRIEAIKNASLSTADALKAMGDSFQVEILRAQGNNVAAIQAEADAQKAGIDKQITALGPNASADALAQANRAKALLDQVTAQKIAEQRASDAAAAADKKAAAADKTPDIVVPPQASAPVPPTTTATTAANDPTITGGKLITLRFEDASGKATTVTAPTQQSADDLLAILKRAGATNIAQAGS